VQIIFYSYRGPKIKKELSTNLTHIKDFKISNFEIIKERKKVIAWHVLLFFEGL
jgi:hypothetical protein